MAIAATILYNIWDVDSDGIIAIIVCAYIAVGFSLLICGSSQAQCASEESDYVAGVAYLHDLEPDQAMFVTKSKAGLNACLAGAQYDKRSQGAWSLYSDEILNLQPIE